MRIAHATDIHFQVAPSLRELGSLKRALGTANLYLAGRRHHFEREVQQALVDHLLSLEPDLVLFTGDFTATALKGEFALAREVLGPVLDAVPSFVIPGNHDVYTPGAQRDRRIREFFGPYMFVDDSPIGRLELEDVVCLGLDPNRPTFLHASGIVPEDQLQALAAALAEPEMASKQVVLCLHYPVLDRHGKVYDNTHHGLLNATALLDVLASAPTKPAFVVHGHEHHGFRVDLDCGGVAVPSFNCGSSGYAYLPNKKRAAAMNLYELEDGNVNVWRYVYDGSGFSPEDGGAYATGR